MLGSFVVKIQKGLSLFTPRRSTLSYSNDDQMEAATSVPDDVKEGHVAVLAIMGEETRRFIVELEYLTDPFFMELLDRELSPFPAFLMNFTRFFTIGRLSINHLQITYNKFHPAVILSFMYCPVS